MGKVKGIFDESNLYQGGGSSTCCVSFPQFFDETVLSCHLNKEYIISQELANRIKTIGKHYKDNTVKIFDWNNHMVAQLRKFNGQYLLKISPIENRNEPL